MKDKLLLIWKHLKPENLKKMWLQSKWIWQYGKRYWKSMVVYTLLGIAGSGVSLVSSFISKDLIDIITGHQTGKLLSTFAAMIGFSIANILFSQASTYASTFINLKVDSEIKNDIFAKMLVTDWESLTDYHTGDLVTRWSSDASNISSGILNWIPNLVIYIFRFISALSVVLYYDPTFALFALIGIPFSAILSKPLLRRMSNNNAKSAAMNAKMYGFNQETFSNIQTIKAFDLIHFYIERLKSLQKEYIQMRMDFQKMSMLTSILMTLIGFIVSYSCYGWGIYRVWSNAITYGTMTMFLSLSGTLTSSVNSLASLVPSAVSLTISAGRLMDIVEMPQEDYSHDDQVIAFEKDHRAEGIGIAMQDHRLKCHLPPENCFLMYLREIPCFPVRLQKICETSNQMPPTKKSSTPCSWHVPGISWKSFRTAFRAWSKNAAADSPKDRHRDFPLPGHCFATRRSCCSMKQPPHSMSLPNGRC